eukprot:1142377-Pelagomonas_calceolata.AAC.3
MMMKNIDRHGQQWPPKSHFSPSSAKITHLLHGDQNVFAPLSATCSALHAYPSFCPPISCTNDHDECEILFKRWPSSALLAAAPIGLINVNAGKHCVLNVWRLMCARSALQVVPKLCPPGGCTNEPDEVVDEREGILLWSDPETWNDADLFPNGKPKAGENKDESRFSHGKPKAGKNVNKAGDSV